MKKLVYFFIFCIFITQTNNLFAENNSITEDFALNQKKTDCCKTEYDSCCEKSSTSNNSCNNTKENSKCHCSYSVTFVYVNNENSKSFIFDETTYLKEIWNYTSIQKQNVVLNLLHPPAI